MIVRIVNEFEIVSIENCEDINRWLEDCEEVNRSRPHATGTCHGVRISLFLLDGFFRTQSCWRRERFGDFASPQSRWTLANLQPIEQRSSLVISGVALIFTAAANRSAGGIRTD
jgi:hypothetical protein